MSSQKSTPVSTPMQSRKVFVPSKTTVSSKFSDENEKPFGTPLSHLKNHTISVNSSPKTPLSCHNRTTKSPGGKSQIKMSTPKTVTSAHSVKASLLKQKPSSASNTTPKRPVKSTRSSTPKNQKIFKSPGRCITPVKVENSVLVQFSQDIFTNSGNDHSSPSQSGSSLNEGSLDPFGMIEKLNRSHSASSLFRLKNKDEETQTAKIKRSLSEAKLSLNSSTEPEGETSRLTVGVRVRPLLPREGMNSLHVNGGEVKVASDLGSEHTFMYDHCFPPTSSQEDVYESLVRPLLDNAFQGYNACLFAYGQTGSGKTYSMMGPYTEEGLICTSSESGMIPRFCQELLEKTLALEEACPTVTATVEVSYLEVYNEKIHDLLVPGNSQLRVREHPVYGPYVVDLSRHTVNSFAEFQHWIEVGNKKRAVAATEMNDKSSRSHSLFTVILTQTFAQVRSNGTWSHDQTRRSQINLVDLAGSERITNSGVSSDRLREGVSINRSLLTLGKVMSALVDRRGFVPYRESVLTWLLKESLGGNSRTCMLATVSPCSNHMDETLSTLRYASQARSIVNRVRVNEAPQDREIRQLREEIERLRGAGERINTLLSENDDLREQLRLKEDQNKILEENLNKLTLEIAKADDTNSDSSKQISVKTIDATLDKTSIDQILDFENQIKSLQYELQQANDENLNLKIELEQSKKKEQDLLQNSECVSTLKIKLQNTETELEKYKSDLIVALSECDCLREELKDKESQFIMANSDLKTSNQKVIDMDEEIRSLKIEVEKFESQLADEKENREFLEKNLKDITMEEVRLKHELEQIPALERALNDLEDELRKCRNDLFEARKSKEELKKKLELDNISELKSELKKCQEDLVEANENIIKQRQQIDEITEREGLLKIKVEKIPTLECEFKLLEAEARKAKRELEEYLAEREEMVEEDLKENNLDGTVYQMNSTISDLEEKNTQEELESLNNNLKESETIRQDLILQLAESRSQISELKQFQEELDLLNNRLHESEKLRQDLILKLTESRLNHDSEVKKLKEEHKSVNNKLQESEKIRQDLILELAESRTKQEHFLKRLQEYADLEMETKNCKLELIQSKERELDLKKKIAECSLLEERLKIKMDHCNRIEAETERLKEQINSEKLLRDKLEKLVSENNITIERLKLKADQTIHLEIELGKCKEEFHKLQITHINCAVEISECRSREEVMKTELAAKNQHMENLMLQLDHSHDTNNKLMEEKLALLKVMEKTCGEKGTKPSPGLLEENITLKNDVSVLKEKLSEKDKTILEKQRKIEEIEALLKAIVQLEKNHEKALAEAKEFSDKDAYKYIMDTAFPHHLVYLVRKARTFSETYRVPYEFEIKNNSVIMKHMMLSAKAKLSHLQLSKWVDRIEAEKTWYKCMDNDLPWEVDFEEYYKSGDGHKITLEDSCKKESSITCGVKVTASGCINPILWRKYMIKRHVMGLKEDSDVLIQYFNEIEDSRIYSILSRIQVSVARLREATQNVEK